MPTPPITTAGTVPNHVAVTPDSNSPSSFDAPTKKPVHRADAAAHCVGRRKLGQSGAYVHAHHVGGAEHEQRGYREREVPQQPKHNRRDSEDRDAREHRKSRAPL
jgi:hypothetical protein